MDLGKCLSISFVVTVATAVTYRDMDSTSLCSQPGLRIKKGEKTVIFAGEAGARGSDKSTKPLCGLPVYADYGTSGKLHVSVSKAKFTYSGINVSLYDGKVAIPSYYKFSVSKYNTYLKSFYTTQRYAVVFLNKTSCHKKHGPTTCGNGFDVRISVSVSEDVSPSPSPSISAPEYRGHFTAVIVGAIVGGILALGLLIGIPICIFFLVVRAGRRRGASGGAVVRAPQPSACQPMLPQQSMTTAPVATPYTPGQYHQAPYTAPINVNQGQYPPQTYESPITTVPEMPQNYESAGVNSSKTDTAHL